MSGLYGTLNSTVRAMAAHSRALETAGKNLANVNNPAYARQRVIFGDRGTVQTAYGTESLGLEALGIEQLRDDLLDRQVGREISLTNAAKAEQAGYQRAQAAMGESIDRTNTVSATSTSDKGIGAALDAFFNSFQTLAASPTDDAQRQNLLQTTSILTDRLQLADQRLAQVQSDLGAQIGQDVDTVNTTLATLADLNAQIARLEVNAPRSAVDLRDQREAKLEELAAKLPFTVVPDATGQYRIEAKDAGGNPVVLVDGGTVQGSVAFDGTQFTGGSPATVLALASGSMQGALGARDGAVQALRDNLDLLAGQLVTSINGAYNLVGAPAAFFDPAGTTAGSIHLANTVTSANLKAGDPAAAGDNTIALAIGQLGTTPFSTAGGDAIDGTFAGFFSKTVSGFGQALSSADARLADQGNIETLVRTQRDAVSGVSLDEEVSDLMKYQRAFQASSRVFNVVADLLDTVVNRLGV